MKRKLSLITLVLISLCLFIESKGQVDPLRKPPTVKPDIKLVPELEEVNIGVKITGMIEKEGLIGYAGVANSTRVIQIQFRTDPVAPGSARVTVSMYFEQSATRKATYSGNSLQISYPMSEYDEIISKLHTAFKEGKDVWVQYSKSNNTRCDIQISW